MTLLPPAHQQSGSEGLPEDWYWVWYDNWIGMVVRNARRDTPTGVEDVFLTHADEIVYSGCSKAPYEVVRAVMADTK